MQKNIYSVGACCLFSVAAVFGQKKESPVNYLDKTKSANEIRTIENKMERLYYTLCGEFTNKRQADTAQLPALAIQQELIAIPIWTERKGEYWIYIGWFKHGQSERALAQSIFRLTKENRDTFVLSQYTLPNLEDNNFYSLEWKKAHPFGDLKPKDLLLPDGCTNRIVESAPNVFEVLEDEDPCPRDVSDAIQFYDFGNSYTPEIINNYTRYYDKDKNFLFGYQRPMGMELVRVSKELATYAVPTKKQAKNK